MQNRKLNLIQKSGIYLRGWAVVCILALILIAIGINIGRVLVSASANYQIYIAEQEGLAELEAEYNQLTKELAYYKSYDYKKLYARDQLNIVEPGQKLYKISQPTEFLEEVDRRREIVKSNEYWDWWITILFPGVSN